MDCSSLVDSNKHGRFIDHVKVELESVRTRGGLSSLHPKLSP